MQAQLRSPSTPAATPLILVGVMTVIGLLLRLPSLGDSLFGDELSTYFTVTGHGLGRTVRIVRSDQELTPPLYYVLAWLTSRLGSSPDALRLPSVLAGVTAIPLTYCLGMRTVGRNAALVGTGLMAASPFLIFYSTEARAYALMLVLGLLSTLALLKALEAGQRRWGRLRCVFVRRAIHPLHDRVRDRGAAAMGI